MRSITAAESGCVWEALEPRSLFAGIPSIPVHFNLESTAEGHVHSLRADPGYAAWTVSKKADLRLVLSGVGKGETVELFARGEFGALRSVGAFANRGGTPLWTIDVDFATGVEATLGAKAVEFMLISTARLVVEQFTPYAPGSAFAAPFIDARSIPSPTKSIGLPASGSGLDGVKLYEWVREAGLFARVSLSTLDLRSYLQPRVGSQRVVFLTHGWNDGLERGLGVVNDDEYMERLAVRASGAGEGAIFAIDWLNAGGKAGTGSNPNGLDSIADTLSRPLDPLSDAKRSALNGRSLGRSLGNALRMAAPSMLPSAVTLIGHSNGGAFIGGMAETLTTNRRGQIAHLIGLDVPAIFKNGSRLAHETFALATQRAARSANIYAPAAFSSWGNPAPVNPVESNTRTAVLSGELALAGAAFLGGGWGAALAVLLGDQASVAAHQLVTCGYGQSMNGASTLANVEFDAGTLRSTWDAGWTTPTHSLVPVAFADIAGEALGLWLAGEIDNVGAPFGVTGGGTYVPANGLDQFQPLSPNPVSSWSWFASGVGDGRVRGSSGGPPNGVIFGTWSLAHPASRLQLSTKVNLHSIDWVRTDGRDAYESIMSIGISGSTPYFDIVVGKHRVGGGTWLQVSGSALSAVQFDTSFTWNQDHVFAVDISSDGLKVLIDNVVVHDQGLALGGPLLSAGTFGVTLGGHTWSTGARYALTADYTAAFIAAT